MQHWMWQLHYYSILWHFCHSSTCSNHIRETMYTHFVAITRSLGIIMLVWGMLDHSFLVLTGQKHENGRWRDVGGRCPPAANDSRGEWDEHEEEGYDEECDHRTAHIWNDEIIYHYISTLPAPGGTRGDIKYWIIRESIHIHHGFYMSLIWGYWMSLYSLICSFPAFLRTVFTRVCGWLTRTLHLVVHRVDALDSDSPTLVKEINQLLRGTWAT